MTFEMNKTIYRFHTSLFDRSVSNVVSVLHFPLNGIRRRVTHVISVCIGISTFTGRIIVVAPTQ
jgi:hypothetical protein